ncbi:hypothetical protein JQ628_22670 [Bradyrhizobium lablabi]|uniref:hypothetical protein n=1 Tax=Bradyrhizobium lablabi TaxID=722472 RepID=UPI001BA73C97|nr:hypothetical protein [Bradyrhizobium lablabi]MBR1124349.1 hypothetical protein [Bradyrhizobium lablabi]
MSTYAAIRHADYKPFTMLPDHSADNTVAIMAPVDTTGGGFLGATLRQMYGCTYRLQEDRLVFEKAKMMGGRIDVTVRKPDEQEKTRLPEAR